MIFIGVAILIALIIIMVMLAVLGDKLDNLARFIYTETKK